MSVKPRVIVFATGWACNRFLLNCKDDYDIIALSDWDGKKHGTFLQGFEIISPYNIKNYEYDFILIASEYIKEIKEQLFNNCNIGEEELLIPFKHQLKYGKPFSDSNTRAFGRKMIVYLSNLMSSNGINIYLDYGTLLGIARDGDIIEWDDDIDFSINQEDVEKTISVLHSERYNFPYSEKLDWHAKVTKDENGDAWNISMLFSNKDEEIFNEFEIGIRVRKLVKGQSIGMLSKYCSCDASHFEKHEKILFEGHEIKVPHNYIEYLDLVYGNWREPAVYGFDSVYGSTEVEDLEEHKIKEIKETLF